MLSNQERGHILQNSPLASPRQMMSSVDASVATNWGETTKHKWPTVSSTSSFGENPPQLQKRTAHFKFKASRLNKNPLPCTKELPHLCLQSPCGWTTRFCAGKILRVCGELFFREFMEVAVPAERGVMLALRKSHHQGPFTLATVTCDQRCHKGLPLRVPMVLREECFGGRLPVCLECIVFQGFRLRAANKATLRADLRADIKRRTSRADIKGG